MLIDLGLHGVVCYMFETHEKYRQIVRMSYMLDILIIYCKLIPWVDAFVKGSFNNTYQNIINIYLHHLSTNLLLKNCKTLSDINRRLMLFLLVYVLSDRLNLCSFRNIHWKSTCFILKRIIKMDTFKLFDQ